MNNLDIVGFLRYNFKFRYFVKERNVINVRMWKGFNGSMGF